MKKVIVIFMPFLLLAGLSLAPVKATACGSSCCKQEKTRENAKAAAKSCCSAKSGNASAARCKMSASGGKCKSACGEQHKKDCSGKCKNCPTCTTASSAAAVVPDFGFQLLPSVSLKRSAFYYQDPYFPNISPDIWQPPKIAA